MRPVELPLAQLSALTLAADARLGGTDYANDHIWQLTATGSEPPALALVTTFGLRARKYQLYPRFVEGHKTASAPEEFDSPPVVQILYPNYALVTFSPFPGIDVIAEYWVPNSQTVSGRLRLRNSGVIPRRIGAEWIAILSPDENGHRMTAVSFGASKALSGKSGGLYPVVFMTGNVQASVSPLPRLIDEFFLLPGGQANVSWGASAWAQPDRAFEAAQTAAAQRLETERDRLQMLNASLVEIDTGKPEWDRLFALSQQTGLSLLVGPTERLPAASPVITRQPEQGYSARGDGSDYNHLWNGQTALDCLYLSELLLPGSANLAKGLLRNFLATQNPETGFVDWKPGLAGQRSRLMATPVLATFAWRIYENSGDVQFLEEVFDPLWRFVLAWLGAERDQDGDGVPEWDHPGQLGLDDHPLFTHWQPGSRGLDIGVLESPALVAFLYKEVQALLAMAKLLGKTESVSPLQAFQDHLRSAGQAAWDPAAATYRYWDRDSHLSQPERLLGKRKGPGKVRLLASPEPVRLHLRLQGVNETTRLPQVKISGTRKGQAVAEEISKERWRWAFPHGFANSEGVFDSIERLEIQGLDAADQVQVYSAEGAYEDLSLLLPLWAGIPQGNEARQLIEQTLLNPLRYWLPYGLPACPALTNPAAQVVHLLYNSLLGRALLRYGYRARAAELFAHLMSGLQQTLNEHGSLRRQIHAAHGAASGERNPLDGLAPINLFLEILGVRIASPWQVHLSGHNPFPAPVHITYQGLHIERLSDHTQLTFPDGQRLTISDPKPCWIKLDYS